jgi:hypothetical protein
MRRTFAAICLTLGTLAAFATPASALTDQDFADWTSVSGNPAVASGTLPQGPTISLSGTTVSPPPQSVVDGTATVFNRADFTPPLANSDAIHFISSTGNSYSLDFGAPVTDPVLHFGSIGSTLDFPPGTAITRLSGDGQFSVSGSDVVGAFEPPTDDGNGTVQLSGTFSSIPFKTTFAGSDGIFLQVGIAPPPPPPAPEPTPPTPPPADVLPGSVIGTCSFAIPWSLSGQRPENVQFEDKPQCTAMRDTCPAGAECTLTTTVRVNSADQYFSWSGEADAAFNDCAEVTSGYFSCDDRFCNSPAIGYQPVGKCPASVSWSGLGPATVDGTCHLLWWQSDPAPGHQPQRGPDDERRLRCSAELKITPTTPLKLVVSSRIGWVQVPEPGRIAVTQLRVFGHGRAAVARSGKQVVAPVSVDSSQAGPVAVPLVLTKAGKKLLRSRGKLALSLRVAFTPTEGEPSVSTQKVTLRADRQPNHP